MQVRAFIMPDRVALMLSAADWLSDKAASCVFHVCFTIDM